MLILEKLSEDRRIIVKSGSHLNALSINVTENCNFACSHCLPKKAEYVSGECESVVFNLVFEDVKSVIDEFLTISKNDQVESKQIFFGRREPLLRWSEIIKMVNYINENARRDKINIQYVMFTNASLITKDIASQLADHKFTLFSSIEGIGEVNDIQRHYYDGSGTFSDILKGWNCLYNAGNPITGASLTLSPINHQKAVNIDLFELLKKYGIHVLAINIDHTAEWETSQLMDVGEILEKAISYSELYSITLRGQWKKVFENMFENPTNSLRQSFCDAHSGFCIHVVPGDSFSTCPSSPLYFKEPMGIRKLLENESYVKSICERQIGRLDDCQGCDIEGFCSGGCTVTSKLIQGTSRFHDRCTFNKIMFNKQLKKFVELAEGDLSNA